MNKKELLSKAKKLSSSYAPIICPNWIIKVDIGDLGYPTPKAISLARLDEKIGTLVFDYQVLEEELEHIVIHELFHIVLEPLHQFCENLYKERTTESERNLLVRFYNTIVEDVIESLTRTITKLKGIEYGTHLNAASYYAK